MLNINIYSLILDNILNKYLLINMYRVNIYSLILDNILNKYLLIFIVLIIKNNTQ